MNQCLFLLISAVVVLKAHAGADVMLSEELTTHAPRCQVSAVPRPPLPAEHGVQARQAIETGWYSPVVADFNGDGWCDFAWAVPYPVNSQMESFSLNELLLLGGAKRWRSAFKGTQPPVFSLDPQLWPSFRVDLTEIALLYVHSGGAPYVLGLQSAYESGKDWRASGCRQHSSVHRWDARVDSFKRVDAAQREAVLNFYYSQVEKPCP